MSSFALKMIAIITMLIDHIGAIFIPGNTMLYMVFRSIGRLAFPIFAFLIVEGFYHTRNVKKYLLRLGLFALISEIPFDLAFYQFMYHEDIFSDLSRIFNLISQHNYNYEYSFLVNKMLFNLLQDQNVFFTLFLGLLLITLMSRVENYFKNKITVSFILDALLVFVFCLIANFLSTDYGYAGILVIVSFYLLKNNYVYLSMALLFIFGYVLGEGQITISTYAVLSLFFIYFYNGKKGKDIKYLFYIFYPAHLLILYLINRFL